MAKRASGPAWRACGVHCTHKGFPRCRGAPTKLRRPRYTPNPRALSAKRQAVARLFRPLLLLFRCPRTGQRWGFVRVLRSQHEAGLRHFAVQERPVTDCTGPRSPGPAARRFAALLDGGSGDVSSPLIQSAPLARAIGHTDSWRGTRLKKRRSRPPGLAAVADKSGSGLTPVPDLGSSTGRRPMSPNRCPRFTVAATRPRCPEANRDSCRCAAW